MSELCEIEEKEKSPEVDSEEASVTYLEGVGLMVEYITQN